MDNQAIRNTMSRSIDVEGRETYLEQVDGEPLHAEADGDSHSDDGDITPESSTTSSTLARLHQELSHLSQEQLQEIEKPRKQITREQWLENKKYRKVLAKIKTENNRLGKMKLYGGRPACLQCDRPAFWELDFCGRCLTAEVETWWVGGPEKRLPYKPKKKDRRKMMRHDLSAAEVEELNPLSDEPRGFCMGERITMRIMHTLLVRVGRQSQNPVIQQYVSRSERHDEMSSSAPGHDLDVFEHSERRDSTETQGSRTANRIGVDNDNSADARRDPSQSWLHETRRSPSRHIESPSFPESVRSPLRSMIGPQRKPTTTMAYPDLDEEGESKLFPGSSQQKVPEAVRTTAKRKRDAENDYGWDAHEKQTSLPVINPAKKTKSMIRNEKMEKEKLAKANHLAALPFHKTDAPDSKDTWATKVIGQIFHMEATARPASDLTVLLAVKKELETRLMDDIMYGDPMEGRPISIPLLRALEPALKNLSMWTT